MLKSLHIEDFVLIACVDLEFGPGFTVLTGETGAGKSIIVSALELLLGGRGDNMLVRRGAERARLEALFEVGAATRALLEAEELEVPGDELALRRDIGLDGRSRCYANGRPVTVAALANLAGSLVELHGQFSELPALKGHGQTDLLDDFGALGGARGAYAAAYGAWQGLLAEKAELERSRAERDVLLDGLGFMIGELEDAALEPGEEEALLEKRARVRHALRIGNDVEGALALLNEGEGAVTAHLAAIHKYLRDLAEVIPSAGPLAARLEETSLALEDLGRELVALQPGAEDEPLDVDALEARLAWLERLKRKYGRDAEGLAVHLDELKEKRAGLAQAGDRMAAVDAELAAAAAEAAARARELSAARRGAAAELAARVGEDLPSLGLEGARFEAVFVAPTGGRPVEEGFVVGAAGAEEVVFDFAANPGEPLRPLAKTASGGELSRVMLAVRAASAGRAGAETVVFDEVDTGIGGRVGHAVGRRLREVAAERQVICVTHLAQIASRARTHYFVDKSVGGERAVVTVAKVEGRGRSEELARILGGGKPPTATTLKHADELLEAAAAENGAAAGRRGKTK